MASNCEKKSDATHESGSSDTRPKIRYILTSEKDAEGNSILEEWQNRKVVIVSDLVEKALKDEGRRVVFELKSSAVGIQGLEETLKYVTELESFIKQCGHDKVQQVVDPSASDFGSAVSSAIDDSYEAVVLALGSIHVEFKKVYAAVKACKVSQGQPLLLFFQVCQSKDELETSKKNFGSAPEKDGCLFVAGLPEIVRINMENFVTCTRELGWKHGQYAKVGEALRKFTPDSAGFLHDTSAAKLSDQLNKARGLPPLPNQQLITVLSNKSEDDQKR